MRVEDDTVAVEDQLVLAAHRVDPGHKGAVVGGAAADHRLAWPALAVVVGRTVDVDQELGAMVCLPSHRAGRKPAVLAHRQTDPDAAHLDDRAAVAWFEIPFLVEDAVVGQENLVKDGLDFTAAEERRRVEYVAFLVDEADDRRDALRRVGDGRQLSDVVAYE